LADLKRLEEIKNTWGRGDDFFIQEYMIFEKPPISLGAMQHHISSNIEVISVT
jgi:hypothetical protein